MEFANLAFTVLGEVKSAGAYSLDRDRLTLLGGALGLAGDLTIYGKRDGVWVIREEDGQRKMIKVDLRSMDFPEVAGILCAAERRDIRGA